MRSVAIVLDFDAGMVHARNAARPRVVDLDVIDRQLNAVRQTVDGGMLRGEGIDQVVILRDPVEVAALVLERSPSRG